MTKCGSYRVRRKSFPFVCVRQRKDVSLHDRILETVHHRVHADGEQMLVVVRVDVGRKGSTKWIGLLVVLHVDLQDTCEADLKFDVAVLVEHVVEQVLWRL